MPRPEVERVVALRAVRGRAEVIEVPCAPGVPYSWFPGAGDVIGFRWPNWRS